MARVLQVVRTFQHYGNLGYARLFFVFEIRALLGSSTGRAVCTVS